MTAQSEVAENSSEDNVGLGELGLLPQCWGFSNHADKDTLSTRFLVRRRRGVYGHSMLSSVAMAVMMISIS